MIFHGVSIFEHGLSIFEHAMSSTIESELNIITKFSDYQ